MSEALRRHVADLLRFHEANPAIAGILKTCPFCKSEAVLILDADTGEVMVKCVRAIRFECHGQTRRCQDEVTAAREWNTRDEAAWKIADLLTGSQS